MVWPIRPVSCWTRLRCALCRCSSCDDVTVSRCTERLTVMAASTSIRPMSDVFLLSLIRLLLYHTEPLPATTAVTLTLATLMCRSSCIEVAFDVSSNRHICLSLSTWLVSSTACTWRVIKPPLATTTAASCNGPVHLFVCSSVCRQNTKMWFSQKTKHFRTMVSIDDL